MYHGINKKFGLCLLILVMFLLAGCKSQAEEDIESVKKFIPPGSKMCIAVAFETISPDGKWDSPKKNVVRFHGSCMYYGVPSALEVNFLAPQDKNPTLAGISINGLPVSSMDFQNILIAAHQVSDQNNAQVSFKGKDSRGANWRYCLVSGCNCHEYIATSNHNGYCATCGHKKAQHL